MVVNHMVSGVGNSSMSSLLSPRFCDSELNSGVFARERRLESGGIGGDRGVRSKVKDSSTVLLVLRFVALTYALDVAAALPSLLVAA